MWRTSAITKTGWRLATKTQTTDTETVLKCRPFEVDWQLARRFSVGSLSDETTLVFKNWVHKHQVGINRDLKPYFTQSGGQQTAFHAPQSRNLHSFSA